MELCVALGMLCPEWRFSSPTHQTSLASKKQHDDVDPAAVLHNVAATLRTAPAFLQRGADEEREANNLDTDVSLLVRLSLETEVLAASEDVLGHATRLIDVVSKFAGRSTCVCGGGEDDGKLLACC